MTNMNSIRPLIIWLILMGLTLISAFVAEGLNHARFAIVCIFVIAAAKGDLVIMHYMEAGRAELHWTIMYRMWLGVVTTMLIFGHVFG
jgi:hypothetical protein